MLGVSKLLEYINKKSKGFNNPKSGKPSSLLKKEGKDSPESSKEGDKSSTVSSDGDKVNSSLSQNVKGDSIGSSSKTEKVSKTNYKRGISLSDNEHDSESESDPNSDDSLSNNESYYSKVVNSNMNVYCDTLKKMKSEELSETLNTINAMQKEYSRKLYSTADVELTSLNVKEYLCRDELEKRVTEEAKEAGADPLDPQESRGPAKASETQRSSVSSASSKNKRKEK